jgi:hypothetical protein
MINNVYKNQNKLKLKREDKQSLMSIRNEYGFKSLNETLSFCINNVFEDMMNEYLVEERLE